MWPFSTSYPTRQPHQLQPEYDYIVVGGGTAGCVLARRLAEDSSCKVLLIERGDARDNWLDRFPLPSTHHFSDGKHSMVLKADMLENTVNIVTGKGLGGTSRINAMQYSRGAPGEYNAWAQSGRKGWSYNELLPYFERNECLYNPVTQTHYGSKGPWQIMSPPAGFLWGLSEQMLEAAKRAGFSAGKDVNDPRLPTSGAFLIHHTIDRSGHRNSTFRAFLTKEFALAHQNNLHICVNTIVRKVELDREDDGSLRAVGVSIQADAPGSASISVKASREIIVCSGALRTPQILMLSGIGPSSHLKETGIPVLCELNGVGSHLQDHAGANLCYQCPLEHSLLRMIWQPWFLIYQLFRYFFFGDGWFLTSLVEVCLLTSAALLDEKSSQRPLTEEEKDSSRPENVPDIEIMASSICEFRVPDFDRSRGALSMLIAPLRPHSHGTIRLRTSDPLDQPLVDLGFLSDPRDRPTMRAAVRLGMRLADEMRATGYALTDLRTPRSTADADVDAFVAKQNVTCLHYSSTCRMAPLDDPDGPGVVDDELRVHGVANLRVCDASIFPQVPAAHLQAPVVVVAEKCAAMIKAAWSTKL